MEDRIVRIPANRGRVLVPAIVLLVAFGGAADAQERKSDDAKPHPDKTEAQPEKRGKADCEAGTARAGDGNGDRSGTAAAREAVPDVVITNEWLEAHYGTAPGTVSAVSGTIAVTVAEGDEPAAARESPDPLQAIADEQARERTRKVRAARLDDAIAGLRARIDTLERRLLAIRNPYLPRPQVPEDERAEWDAMDGRQRVEWTQRQLDEARRALDAAQRERDDLTRGR